MKRLKLLQNRSAVVLSLKLVGGLKTTNNKHSGWFVPGRTRGSLEASPGLGGLGLGVGVVALRPSAARTALWPPSPRAAAQPAWCPARRRRAASLHKPAPPQTRSASPGDRGGRGTSNTMHVTMKTSEEDFILQEPQASVSVADPEEIPERDREPPGPLL